MSEQIKKEMQKIEDTLTTSIVLNPSVGEGLRAVRDMIAGKFDPFEQNAVRGVFYIKGKYDGLKIALQIIEGKSK
jgi:hypothetical protein